MAAAGLVVAGTLAQNPLLTLACVATLPILGVALWFPGEPPILLASCAMQWLQVVTGVVYADVQGLALIEVFESPQTERAIWLSLLGVLVLALGMRVAVRGHRAAARTRMTDETRSLDLRRVFIGWVVSFAIASSAALSSQIIPGFEQLIYALIGLKWVFCFMLAYGVLTRSEGYAFLSAAILIEFWTGFLGYFADFKEVFFMVFLAAACTRTRWSARSRMLLAAGLVVVVAASILWTAVKKDYRLFQQSGVQEGRPQKLGTLLLELDASRMHEAVELLALRVEYTQYFALALDHVPAVVPYEHGKLWLGAITHVFMPRMFFPHKAALDDSDRTIAYTGAPIAGSAQGTSIGMGYMAESYVDFGPYLMFVPIFLLGVFFGVVYRFFAFGNASPLLGASLATAILFPTLQAFATSNVKIFGGTVTSSLVMFGLNYFGGVELMRWLMKTRAVERRPGRAFGVARR